MAAADLTAARLRELLHYDPETGVFTTVLYRNGSCRVGGTPGCHDKSLGYVSMRVDGRNYRAHRLAWLYMTGDFPAGHIDHIDGNGVNNRFANLRDVIPIENSRNQKLGSLNKSGLAGVDWRPSREKWRATISVRRKQIALGHFDSLLDAVAARRRAEREYGFHPNHGRR